MTKRCNDNTGNPPYKLIKFILTFVLCGSFMCSIGQKTDKVKLKNGDNITGEIRSMKLGILSFNMDGPGTISIKWEEVTRINSDKVFEVTLHGGDLVVGVLDSIIINYHVTSLDDLVEIIPIKDKFLKRLIGDVNMGFNYTKSNATLQFNLSSNISYKIPKREFILKLNSVVTNNNADSSLSKKQDITGTLRRYMDNNFFWGGSIGWQQNSELGLQSRYLLSGVFGKTALADNHNRLLFSSGLSYNQEQSVESKTFTGYLDALFGVTYKRFYHSTPKLSLDADYILYPGLSDWGRIRMQGDLNFSVEIFKDFLVGLVFYYSYDNHPPEGSLSNDDYGLMFTLGYSFGK